MPTPSNNLRITLIGTGEQAGTWGNTTNLNLGTLIEQAIVGYTSKTVTSSPASLVVADGESAEFRNANFRLLSTLSTDFRVFVPPYTKSYTMVNSSNYSAYIAVATTPNTTAPAQTFSATIADTTMTVISVSAGVLLSAGLNIASVAGSSVAANTRIVSQLNGTPGGDGQYRVSVSQAVTPQVSMYAALRIPPSATMTFFSTGTSLFESLNNVAGDLIAQGTLAVGSDATFGGNGAFGGTGSLATPAGTTAQRTGTGIRYNTTLSRYEGYDINASTWSTIGGGATGGGANQVFYENDQNITASYSISANKNAMTTGPVTITSFSAIGSITNVGGVFTLTISGANPITGALYIGAPLAGNNVSVGTIVTGFGTGTGGAGTYTLNQNSTGVSGSTVTSEVVVTVPTTSNWVILG